MDLHILRRGSGEPLLLIQGMSGTHRSWGEPFLSELERDFDVACYDHRGIGLSPRCDDPFTIADLADDAAQVIAAQGWESAHVLGISMGGMVAQELALRHPERVRTLALGCTYAGGEGQALTAPEIGMKLFGAMQSGDRELALRTGWEVNVSPAFAADEDAYAQFREAALAVPAPVPVIMLQVQAIGGHDTSARLAEIAVPTLVVHGTADQMLPASNGEAIARTIPGATLHLMEGVGHVFWVERPEESARVLREHALAHAA